MVLAISLAGKAQGSPFLGAKSDKRLRLCPVWPRIMTDFDDPKRHEFAIEADEKILSLPRKRNELEDTKVALSISDPDNDCRLDHVALSSVHFCLLPMALRAVIMTSPARISISN